MDYKGAEEYILKKLRDDLPANLYYHNVNHTIDVVTAVEKYAKFEKIKEKDLILLKTAAVYHDSGFLIRYNKNEISSVQIIEEVLPDFGFSPVEIDIIARMIMCTELPSKPKNILEKIICDADLDYIGTSEFYIKGIRLLREWNENGMITTLKEWYYQELYFLQQHEYFTKSAICLRQDTKLQHLAQIKELLGE